MVMGKNASQINKDFNRCPMPLSSDYQHNLRGTEIEEHTDKLNPAYLSCNFV